MENSKHSFEPTPKQMLQMSKAHNGTFFPPMVLPHCIEKVKNFEVRDDDIILATYPKCGRPM